MTESSIESVLRTDGAFVKQPSGGSMRPTLKSESDQIVVRVPDRPLKKGDVVLYKTETDFILHRIIKIRKNAYILRGDSCMTTETVLPENVLGILVGRYRNGKYKAFNNRTNYAFAGFWKFIFPIRWCYRKASGAFRRIFRKKGNGNNHIA